MWRELWGKSCTVIRDQLSAQTLPALSLASALVRRVVPMGVPIWAAHLLAKPRACG